MFQKEKWMCWKIKQADKIFTLAEGKIRNQCKAQNNGLKIGQLQWKAVSEHQLTL